MRRAAPSSAAFKRLIAYRIGATAAVIVPFRIPKPPCFRPAAGYAVRLPARRSVSDAKRTDCTKTIDLFSQNSKNTKNSENSCNYAIFPHHGDSQPYLHPAPRMDFTAFPLPLDNPSTCQFVPAHNVNIAHDITIYIVCSVYIPRNHPRCMC